MKTTHSLRATKAAINRLPAPLVLVPTMGALHEGHAALIRKARKVGGEDGSLAVSLFVNPTQFGPGEDLSAYPRPLDSDLRLCKELGVDLVFAPSPSEMYFPDASTVVDEQRLSLPLCGKSRPGHFQGVCTVVAKLFNIFQPHAAVFGEKDWQQLAVIRQMVRDLNFPVRIISHPIVREKDGLALSSRNAYLGGQDRGLAAGFARALRAAAQHKASPSAIVRRARIEVSKIPGAKIDYIEAVDANSLGAPRCGHKARLIAAVFFGKTRLIDNVPIGGLPLGSYK